MRTIALALMAVALMACGDEASPRPVLDATCSVAGFPTGEKFLACATGVFGRCLDRQPPPGTLCVPFDGLMCCPD